MSKTPDSYFVIIVSEDGEASIRQYDRTGIKQHLDKGYFGCVTFQDGIANCAPACWDTGEKCRPMLIIKGRIVVPKPQKVVTQWTLEEE